MEGNKESDGKKRKVVFGEAKDDVSVAGNDSTQESTGADGGEPTPPDPAPAKNQETSDGAKKPKRTGVDQRTLDWIKECRAKYDKLRADPLYQEAVKERKANLTKYLAIQPKKEYPSDGGPPIEVPVLDKDGKPKLAEDIDWIEEELSKLTKIEAGELDMMDSGSMLHPYADHTYEQLHGSPIDFWKGLWYWEIFGFPGPYDLWRTTDRTLRCSRKYYDLYKETVENTNTYFAGNDPAKSREYRDVLRLVIQSKDSHKDGILKRFLRYAKEHGKSGPGEEPIALVAVRQAEKDKDNTEDETSVYIPKESSQAIILELQRMGFDFDETNERGESANSVLSSRMKNALREREQDEFQMWKEGERTAAAFDPNYVYEPPTNHCGCNWSDDCCNKYRQPDYMYMDEPGEFLSDY